jgi:LPS sulfotransferase NodH
LVTATPSSYLVLASQRSGSTLLVESLRATGVAGEPQEFFQYLPATSQAPQPREWFAGVEDETILSLLDPLDPGTPDLAPAEIWRDYIRTVGRTPNGVWGGKLMWNHTDDLLARARELEQVPDDADLDATLRALFGDDLKLVYVTRPDKVAQAVSLWTAVQTQSWRAGRGTPAAEARYAFAGVDHLVRQLEEQDAAWRDWLAATGRAAHAVAYDALASDPAGAIGDVLRFLGLPADDVPAPATERQGDGRSAEWADRYRRETEAVA